MTSTPVTTRPTSVTTVPGESRHARRVTVRAAVTGAVSGVLGIAPHVLHHVGFLAGTALVAGSGGTAVFAAVGLAASVPFLLRLYRRFGSWRAPAIGVVVFTAMFALSAFVIGPAISGGGSGTPTSPSTPTVDHSSHH